MGCEALVPHRMLRVARFGHRDRFWLWRGRQRPSSADSPSHNFRSCDPHSAVRLTDDQGSGDDSGKCAPHGVAAYKQSGASSLLKACPHRPMTALPITLFSSARREFGRLRSHLRRAAASRLRPPACLRPPGCPGWAFARCSDSVQSKAYLCATSGRSDQL
jgi:hypothetical protein